MANHPNRSKATADVTQNRVWIELEKPLSKEHAQKQCDLANNMLKRLSADPAKWTVTNAQHFFVGEREGCVPTYRYGGGMGFNDLPDRGTWFNLDYMGR